MRVVSRHVQDTDEAPEQLGRRERKKAETRRSIVEVALSLALEQGLESLTVAQISDAVDIAPRTFFNYFSCKEEALVGDGTITAAELRTRIADRPRDEAPLDTLRVVMVTTTQGVTGSGRDQVRARQQLIQEHVALRSRQMAQFATVERALAAGIAERLGVDPDDDPRPEVLAALALGVMRVSIRRWAKDASRPLDDLVAAGFDLLRDEAGTSTPSTSRPPKETRSRGE